MSASRSRACTPSRFASLAALVPSLIAILAGCAGEEAQWKAGQKPTFPVTGTVTFKGTPVEGAHVSFHPPEAEGGTAAFGRTHAQGVYKLQTYAEGDGAPAGTYKVTVQKTQGTAAQKSGEELFKEMEQQSKSGKKPAAEPEAKSDLPAKFASPATSPLEATVKSEPNDIPLELME